jgi:hypothetical protein
VSAHATECPRCGAALPPHARFCAKCGLPVEDATAVERIPPHETTEAPATFDVAMPRYFGVTPPMLLFALATATLAIAIALAILEHWVAAIVLAVVSLALLALFIGVSRRKPDTAFSRGSARAVDRVRERTGWLLESAAIRSETGRRVGRLRQELLADDGRRDALLRELGLAVYSGDSQASERVKGELDELTASVQAKEEEMEAILDSAQERIARGRSRVQPTMIEPPQPVPTPEPGPPPDEGTPPTPPEIPEPSPPPDEGTIPTPDPVPEPSPEPGTGDSRT